MAEFRRNIRVALNEVERGESVYITRHNRTFAVIKSPVSFLKTGEASINIRPDVPKKNNRLPSATNEGAKAWNAGAKNHLNVPQTTAGEQACCSTAKPCRHWQWDSDNTVWINSLSGRERGAE